MNNKILPITFAMILLSTCFVSASENKIWFGRNESEPLQMIPVLLTSSGVLRTDMNFSKADIWNTNLGELTNTNSSQFYNNAGVLSALKSWWDGLYCELTGCTMIGDIDMGGNDILNVDVIEGYNKTVNLTTFYDLRYLTGELALYFYNSTDPHNSSYTVMNITIPTGTEQRDSFENLVGGDNLLTKRILSTLNLSILERGAYNQHTTIDYISGTKDVSMRSELYILYENGTETLIGNSPPSIGLIVGIYQQIIWTGIINEDVIFPEGSHLTMYLYATVSGSGQAPDLDLVVGADTAARLDIGINPTDIKTIEVDPFSFHTRENLNNSGFNITAYQLDINSIKNMSKFVDIFGRTRIAGDGVQPRDTIYTFSLQTNTSETWLEILNENEGGAFFGMANKDFEIYNWAGGSVNFYTDPVPKMNALRFEITEDGVFDFKNNPLTNMINISGSQFRLIDMGLASLITGVTNIEVLNLTVGGGRDHGLNILGRWAGPGSDHGSFIRWMGFSTDGFMFLNDENKINFGSSQPTTIDEQGFAWIDTDDGNAQFVDTNVSRLVTGSNTYNGLSAGDINVSTVFYDTLTAKSPMFMCSDDWCSVSFPKFQKTLWLQKNDNYTILDIVYNNEHYTKQTFWNLVQGTEYEELSLKLNEKILRLQEKKQEDIALESTKNSCNYQWDGECFENVINNNLNYNQVIDIFQINETIEVSFACSELNSTTLEVYDSTCTKEQNTGQTINSYQFKTHCGWAEGSGYYCEVRELR